MADPDSRDAGKDTPVDAAQETTGPLTLSDPEPVTPKADPVEEAEVVRKDETMAPDEAELSAAAPEAAPLPPPTPPRATPTQPAKRGAGGFFALLLGGAIAAGLGFGLARYVPEGWPLAGAGGDDRDAAQDSQIAALGARLDEANAPAGDQVATLAAELAEAQAQARSALDAVAALEERMSGVESAPGGGAAPADVTALQEEVAALRSQIEGGAASAVNADIQAAAEAAEARLAEAQAQADALKSEVEATARRATTSASLSRVRAALDSGTGYAAPLDDIAAAGIEIPAVLIDGAQGGIPTIASLETAFPEAARAALDASLLADMGDTFAGRVSTFVRAQAGARSLTPREGTDPDAVLSRAEAAVKAGDLSKALTEIGALPQEGQAAMAGWTAEAQKRIDATDAVAALAAAAEAK